MGRIDLEIHQMNLQPIDLNLGVFMVVLPQTGILKSVQFDREAFSKLPDNDIRFQLIMQNQFSLFNLSKLGIDLIGLSLGKEEYQIDISEWDKEGNFEFGCIPMQSMDFFVKLQVQSSLTHKELLPVSIDVYEVPFHTRDLPDFGWYNCWRELMWYPTGYYHFPVNAGFLRRVICTNLKDTFLSYGPDIRIKCDKRILNEDVSLPTYFPVFQNVSMDTKYNPLGIDMLEISNLLLRGEHIERTQPARIICQYVFPVRVQ